MAEKTLKSIQFPGLEGRYNVPEGGGGGTVTKESIETALGFAPIGEDDVPVKTVNGAVGEVKSTYYVSVAQGNGVFATADKSAQAVYDAYAAGYAVYARVQFRGVAAPFVLPLVAAEKDGSAIKLGFGALGSISRDNPPQYPTVAYTGEAWAAWLGTLARASDIPSIPSSLPNPNALSIKIGDTTTSYDGSEAKTVEIPTAGSADVSLGVSGAAIGQTIKVKAVDTDGKPTKWDSYGWETIADFSVESEDIVYYRWDVSGKDEFIVLVSLTPLSDSSTNINGTIGVNGIGSPWNSGKDAYSITSNIQSVKSTDKGCSYMVTGRIADGKWIPGVFLKSFNFGASWNNLVPSGGVALSSDADTNVLSLREIDEITSIAVGSYTTFFGVGSHIQILAR